MIIIAESRKLKMSDVLAHPLGPLPWSLAATHGSLRKTNKAVLDKELEKNVPPAETIPGPCATIIDGMSIVQRMKGDHKTFAELADTILKMILNEHPQSSRVDVVFDVYREVSIKNAGRKKEADTRLLLHAEHASKNSYRSVIIVFEDADVLVLCLAYQSRIPSSLYQKCGSQTRARFVDIATIRQAVGEELCNALPGIH